VNGYWRRLLAPNRNIRLFLVGWGLNAFAFFGVQGVLLNLYLLRLGFDTRSIGYLIAAGEIVWALAALPAGAVGRKLGPRIASVAGSLLDFAGLALLLLARSVPHPIAWMYAGWMIFWIGAALLTVNSIPFVQQASPEEDRGFAFASLGIVVALMGFLGSAVAGWLPVAFAQRLSVSLGQPDPYWYPLWLVPLAHLVCVPIWMRARLEKAVNAGSEKDVARPPVGLFVFFGLMVFFQTASEGSVRAFFNVYLDQALRSPTALIGAILGIGQLVPALVALAVPRLLRRWGTPMVLLLATWGAAVATVPLAVFPHWVLASLAFVTLMSMYGISGPGRNVFSLEVVSPRWRTTTAAITTIGLALGWASTAAMGGFLIPLIGFGGVFLTSTLLAFISGLLALGYIRSRRRTD
jgi:MFS family permease